MSACWYHQLKVPHSHLPFSLHADVLWKFCGMWGGRWEAALKWCLQNENVHHPWKWTLFVLCMHCSSFSCEPVWVLQQNISRCRHRCKNWKCAFVLSARCDGSMWLPCGEWGSHRSGLILVCLSKRKNNSTKTSLWCLLLFDLLYLHPYAWSMCIIVQSKGEFTQIPHTLLTSLGMTVACERTRGDSYWVNNTNSNCYFDPLPVGVEPAVHWAMSVPAYRTALPRRCSSDVRQLSVLPVVRQAGGRGLQQASALWHTPRTAVWLQRQFSWRAWTVCRCEQDTVKLKVKVLG